MNLDASCIYPGLYQGSAPDVGPLVASEGFTTLVLCARQWQPPHSYDPTFPDIYGYKGEDIPYPGVEVLYAPMWDDETVPPPREVLALAIKTAALVADRVQNNGKVLVTCLAGKNRSGLVTAIALHKLTGMAGTTCVAVLKMARPIALTNMKFVDAIASIKAKQEAHVAHTLGSPGQRRFIVLPLRGEK